MKEKWTPIKDFEEYEVSTSGLIKHHPFITSDGRHIPERILKGIPDKDGYLQIRLWKNGKGHTKKIHRLVAEAFISNPDPERFPLINHVDGNKQNNSVENLEWCNHSQNIKHAYEHGLRHAIKGEANNQHKLTASDVKYIRQNCIPHDPQFGMRAMAKKFNVCCSTIRNIYHGVKWRTEA